MKIYFIRHGESEYNLAQRHSGWAQVELTEQGKAQAESLRTYLSKIPFDKLYVSDLKRAIQTSQLAIPGSNAEQTPLLYMPASSLSVPSGLKMSIVSKLCFFPNM